MSDFEISYGLQRVLAVAIAEALDSSVIRVYGSPISQTAADALVPANASASIGSATLLCTISVDGGGTGGTFDSTPVNGAVYKSTAEVWSGINTAYGYPSFYRIGLASDDDSETTTRIRAQGTAGDVLKDFYIASIPMALGAEQRADNYSVGVPLQ